MVDYYNGVFNGRHARSNEASAVAHHVVLSIPLASMRAQLIANPPSIEHSVPYQMSFRGWWYLRRRHLTAVIAQYKASCPRESDLITTTDTTFLLL